MKKLAIVLALLVYWIGLVSGCSGDRPVAGGTRGTLTMKSVGLRDVRIDVYAAGALEPIGFGITSDGGSFELYQTDARGALELTPGEYSFTLESVGPEPLALRPELRDVQRTPLRKHWVGMEPLLELALP